MRVKIKKTLGQYGRNRDTLILLVIYNQGEDKSYQSVIDEICGPNINNIEIHCDEITEELDDLIDTLLLDFDVTVVTSLSMDFTSRGKKRNKYLHYRVEFYTNSKDKLDGVDSRPMNLFELENLNEGDDIVFYVENSQDIAQSACIEAWNRDLQVYYVVYPENYNSILDYLMSISYGKWYLQMIMREEN